MRASCWRWLEQAPSVACQAPQTSIWRLCLGWEDLRASLTTEMVEKNAATQIAQEMFDFQVVTIGTVRQVVTLVRAETL